MSKLPVMVPVTDLRQAATAILKKISKSREPVVITQRGRAAAVIVSVESYEHSQREIELLKLLAKGELEVEAGAGHTLKQVMAEADALLGEGAF